MFKRTTITMTLATIVTVAVNLQAPVLAAEPSSEPVITETPGLPSFDSFVLGSTSLEDALADYLAGLGPEEGDFGGPAESAALPDHVTDAIMDSVVALPGLSGLPPLTVEDTEPPIDEPVCGEPGAICDEPDEGAELPLDPTDTCSEDGVACELDPTVDDEGMPFDDESVPADDAGASEGDRSWDVPTADDSEAPFDDHGWVESDHEEASDTTHTNTNTGADTRETEATTTTVAAVSTTINDSVDAAITETSGAVADVALVIAATSDEGTTEGFDPVAAGLIGLLASMTIAGFCYGAFMLGRRGA